MNLTQEQIHIMEEEIEDAWTYIGASMSSGKAFYVLKGINDEIKNNGYDWNYDLTPRGQKLQNLYEAIYAANREEFEK